MKTPVCFNHWYWLAALLAASCLSSHAARDGQGPLLGKPAPAFNLHGIYGENYSLETFKGHILVMQFGTSW
jgi:hypothetical protein